MLVGLKLVEVGLGSRERSNGRSWGLWAFGTGERSSRGLHCTFGSFFLLLLLLLAVSSSRCFPSVREEGLTCSQ